MTIKNNLSEHTEAQECGSTFGMVEKQGSILSLFYFNLCVVTVTRKLNLDMLEIGVEIGIRYVKNVRYADDTTLLTDDGHTTVNLKSNGSEISGLQWNIKKTNIMTTAENTEVKINI